MSREVSERLSLQYLAMLLAGCLIFLCLPIWEGGGLTGERFRLGWPLPFAECKVGFVSAESPTGAHYSFGWLSLVTITFWSAIFLTIYHLDKRFTLPGWLLYPGIIIFFSLGLLGLFAFGFLFLTAYVTS